ITLWEVETGKPGKRFQSAGPQGDRPRFALSYSPDGKWLARVAGRLVSVLDSNTGKARFSIDLKELGYGQRVSFVPSNPDQLAVTSENRAGAWFVSARTGRIIATVETHATVESLSPTGKYFVGKLGGGPHLVDVKTGKIVCDFPEALGPGGPEWVLSPD